MSERVIKWLLFNTKWKKNSAMPWREQIAVKWDDDVRFVLDQYALLHIYCASSLKQQSIRTHYNLDSFIELTDETAAMGRCLETISFEVDIMAYGYTNPWT
jgi:hypothetical protein